MIGAAVRRVEDARFLTGAGSFVADLAFAGELHCVLVRSPMLERPAPDTTRHMLLYVTRLGRVATDLVRRVAAQSNAGITDRPVAGLT